MTRPGMSAGPIIVGVDGSPSSLAALEWAARQAELTNSALEVITAWEWPTTYVPLAFATDWNLANEAKRVLDDAVLGARASHPGIKITTTLVEGHPAPVLVALSRGAQMLVVGNRGHGEFVGMLHGSVSEHCATNAFCPVLVLREA